jgi:hypothetical protein
MHKHEQRWLGYACTHFQAMRLHSSHLLSNVRVHLQRANCGFADVLQPTADA